MDMLSRYLYAVYNDLPKGEQRDDIIAEISSTRCKRKSKSARMHSDAR